MHDILDYSSLRKGKLIFEKNNEIINIKDAVGEIIDIQKDKCDKLQLEVKVEYYGFNNNQYLIKTDKKRIQQVLLNIL